MTYPTTYDMLYRRAAIARSMAFQNLEFAAETLRSLQKGEIEDCMIPRAKVLVRTAIEKARRNGDSSRFLGCGLHRI